MLAISWKREKHAHRRLQLQRLTSVWPGAAASWAGRLNCISAVFLGKWPTQINFCTFHLDYKIWLQQQSRIFFLNFYFFSKRIKNSSTTEDKSVATPLRPPLSSTALITVNAVNFVNLLIKQVLLFNKQNKEKLERKSRKLKGC